MLHLPRLPTLRRYLVFLSYCIRLASQNILSKLPFLQYLTVFNHIRLHHLLPTEKLLKPNQTLMSLAVAEISWGKVRVVSLHSGLTSLGDSRTRRTDLFCQFANHTLNLWVEVVDIGCLHLLEMLQLFSVSKLHLTLLSQERLCRIFILNVCRWHSSLSFASQLVVKVPILSSPLAVGLELFGEVWPLECFGSPVKMIWLREVAYLAVHFNTKNNNA